MKRICTFFLLSLALLLAAPAYGQGQSEEEACPVGELDMSTADASAAKAESASETLSAAERRVQDIIARDGIHVVHFWAPWCANSKSELGNGWAQLVRSNPEVSFTFVTVWTEGASGAQMLDKYNVPDRVVELTQSGGSESQEAGRVHSFLDLPVTWIPSTWIFHNNGELAFAMNYGEMKMRAIQQLIDVTRQNW